MLERGRKIGITDCIWVIMVGALYFCWACHLQQSWCPDEYMRDDVAFWILQNGRLPVGNEPELINPIWGFSRQDSKAARHITSLHICDSILT